MQRKCLSGGKDDCGVSLAARSYCGWNFWSTFNFTGQFTNACLRGMGAGSTAFHGLVSLCFFDNRASERAELRTVRRACRHGGLAFTALLFLFPFMPGESAFP